MVRRDGMEARKERIQTVAKIVLAELYEAKKNGLDYVPLQKTRSKIKYEMGITEEKLTEYMEICQSQGFFETHLEKDQIRKPSM